MIACGQHRTNTKKQWALYMQGFEADPDERTARHTLDGTKALEDFMAAEKLSENKTASRAASMSFHLYFSAATSVLLCFWRRLCHV